MWQGAHPSSRQMYLRAFTCPGQILVHGRVVHLRRVGDAAGSGIGARLCGGVHGRNHLFLSRARESAQTGIYSTIPRLAPPVKSGKNASAEAVRALKKGCTGSRTAADPWSGNRSPANTRGAVPHSGGSAGQQVWVLPSHGLDVLGRGLEQLVGQVSQGRATATSSPISGTDGSASRR